MLDILITQLRTAGGPVLIALFVVSIAATAVTIFKIVQFSRLGAGRSTAARTAVSIWASGDRAKALYTARQERSPASATVASAMSSLIRFPGDRQRAQEIASQAALDQLTKMGRHLRILESIAQVAPMMGLLGTVIGMISAFGELSKSGGAIDPSALATGIWAALLTTAAGLAVAIPFYFIWVWLNSRVEEERATMEAAIGAILVANDGARRGRRRIARPSELGRAASVHCVGTRMSLAKLHRPQRHRRMLFVLTPLIDVMFLLLIFFMLSSQIAPYSLIPLTRLAVENEHDVEPTSPATPDIAIRVSRGFISVGGERMAVAELASRLKLFKESGFSSFVIVPDALATVQDIVATLEAVQTVSAKSATVVVPGGDCKSADRPRPPDARVGGTKESDRAATGRRGKMRDRCIGSDIDARPFEQMHHLRPFHLMSSGDAVPNLVQVAPFGFSGSSYRNNRQTMFGESRSECSPSLRSRFLVGEHRGGMDQSEIAAGDDLRIGRGRRSYKLRHALDSKDVGKAQHLFNAMELVRGRNAFLQSKVLQCAGEPWVVVSRYAGTIWSGGKGECCRAVTALRGHRDIVLPPEPREEPGALRECRSRRHGDDAIDVRVAVTIPAVLVKTSASISALGHARRRLRINGVVRSRSPMRRSEMTRTRDGSAAMISFVEPRLVIRFGEAAGLERLAE